jgi:hypothetical protein
MNNNISIKYPNDTITDLVFSSSNIKYFLILIVYPGTCSSRSKTKIAIDIVGTSSDDQYKTIDIPSYEIVVIIIIFNPQGK